MNQKKFILILEHDLQGTIFNRTIIIIIFATRKLVPENLIHFKCKQLLIKNYYC